MESNAITAAINAWNNDAGSNVVYALNSSNANTSGGVATGQVPDGVNNVVWEINFGSDFVCQGGGLIGLGGVTTTQGTHSFSQTFFTIKEGDVALNRGLLRCVGANPGISVGDFQSGVTHEMGHTLGFRHSDKNRTDTALCSTNTNLECSSSAIMTATVTGGLSATLNPWDQHAVQTVYPSGSAPSTPTGVTAIATLPTSVTVSWTASTGSPTSYQVQRSTSGTASFTDLGSPVSAPTTTFNDTTVSANTAYLYRVIAINAGGSSSPSNYDLATTVMFTEDPLVAGVTPIKVNHLKELRLAVDAVQTLAIQTPTAYTDNTPLAGVTPVKAVHITELQTRLNTAMGALSLTTGFTETPSIGTLVNALHFQEIRNRVK